MWTGAEIAYLRRNAELGAAAIAAELGRSVRSVQQCAYRLRISLRPPGERRGHVLGQGREISLREELRDAALAGRVPAEALEARRRISEPELCPACAVREISVSVSGLCRVCHLRAIERRHREELARIRAEDEAQRGVWQARQEVKRERDRLGAGV